MVKPGKAGKDVLYAIKCANEKIDELSKKIEEKKISALMACISDNNADVEFFTSEVNQLEYKRTRLFTAIKRLKEN